MISGSNVAVSFDKHGKVLIDLPRAFKVRTYALDSDDNTLVEEIVWAHSYTPLDGCLAFTYYKSKVIRVYDEEKKIPVDQEVALQTFNRTFAPGTWFDVVEVNVPDIKPDAKAH